MNLKDKRFIERVAKFEKKFNQLPVEDKERLQPQLDDLNKMVLEIKNNKNEENDND